MAVVLPPVDRILARDYPRPIRHGYRQAVRSSSLPDRHHQLLRLGESSLAYLASLAFADYRRLRADDPDENVERFLDATKQFTMGQYVTVLRKTHQAVGRQEIFGVKGREVNVRLDAAQPWVSALRAIEYAGKIGATDVRRVVEADVVRAGKAARWLGFWDELVTYRNRIAHADAHGWPVDAVGYFDVMTPALEAALVDALRTDYVGHVLLEYPVARMVDVRRARTGWVQRSDGEHHGVPLVEEVVRDAPPEQWESEVDCPYVLQRSADGWLPHSRFYDLSDGVPTPLPAGSSARRRADAPATVASARLERSSADDRDRAKQGDGIESASSAGQKSRARTGFDALPEVPRATSAEGATDQRAPAPTRPWFPSLSPWMLWGILSFGLLAGVGFLAAATRVHDVKLRNAGLAYSALGVLVLVVAGIAGTKGERPVLDAIGVTLMIGVWIVSTIHAFVVNPGVRRKRVRAVREG